MSNKHPVEALLRDPVELWSSYACFIAAGLSILAPGSLMMTPSVAYALSSIFIIYGCYRFRQGLNIIKYQRSLRMLKSYILSSHQIPRSKTKLFLGLGFRWDDRHTQRLYDTERRYAKKYTDDSFGYKLARKIEFVSEKIRILRLIAYFTSQVAWWNPVTPKPPVGGNPCIHAVGLVEGEFDIWMDLGERVGHTVVLGTTRVGKTRLAEMLITQDIHRGDVVFVFDPKGDAELLKRMYAEAKAAGRLNQFKIFHLGYPDISVRYNPVGEFSRITEVAGRVSSQIPGSGNSAAFREFVWRFVNIVAKARVELGVKPDFTMIERDVTNIEPLLIEYYEYWLEKEAEKNPQLSNWRQVIQSWVNAGKDDPNNKKFSNLTTALRGRDRYPLSLIFYARDMKLFDSTADGLRSAFEYDKTYADKITASLLPLMSKLTTGSVGKLLAPDYLDPTDKRQILDWRKEIRSGGIIYVGLDALSDADVAGAVGNSMFADLTSIAGEIYKFGMNVGLPDVPGSDVKRKISIHADEFNELIGPEFVPMLNKAGGAGYQVTVYTQTWADVEAKLQDRAKAQQVAGNLNTMIMLRVKNEDTAKMMTSQLKEVEIHQLTQVSGATDDANASNDTDFTSRTEDRITTQKVPLLQPGDLTQLPKGQCFALIEGGQLYKLRLPLANPVDDALPDSLESVVSDMERRYSSEIDRWENVRKGAAG